MISAFAAILLGVVVGLLIALTKHWVGHKLATHVDLPPEYRDEPTVRGR